MTRMPSARGASHPPSRQIESFLEMLVAERGAARNTVEAYGRDLEDYTKFLARIGETPASAGAECIRRISGGWAEKTSRPGPCSAVFRHCGSSIVFWRLRA
jgi:integrase/recombinase XerD